MSPASRAKSEGESGTAVVSIVALLALGTFVGVPGVGLFAGLVLASVITVKATADDPAPIMRAFAALRSGLWHPSGPAASAPAPRRLIPNRLSTYWSLALSGLFAAIPLVLAGVTTLQLPKLLAMPAMALPSFGGYALSFRALVAASRKDAAPTIIEWRVVRERSASIGSAAVVGASLGIVAYLGFAHAHLVASLVTTGHAAASSGPDAFGGFGLGGAIGASTGIGLLAALAMASVAYRATWLLPHQERERVLSELEEAWRGALPSTVPPPLFISESREPADSPEIRTALFQVGAATTIDAYAARADRFASALGVEVASVVPDVARDGNNNPMPGATSANVFRATWPLVPISPSAHLSPSFTTKTPLYDFIVANTFRRIFAELRLGQPTFWALTILTTPESPSRIVETMWMLDPKTTFDQVAKAADAIAEKAGARWLRIGRRTTLHPEGDLVPGSYVSVIFGDPPERATFVNGSRFKSDDHRRFTYAVDWEQRMRKVGLSEGGVCPMLLGFKDVEGELRLLTGQEMTLRVWTFSYHPTGLSPEAVAKAMPALKASGLPYVGFRPGRSPDQFELLTADTDPLSLVFPFMTAAPSILRRPKPGQARLEWVVGVGPDGSRVTFEFGTDDPHLLVAGMTGSGKSNGLISMLLQLATANSPDDLNFRIADPKTALVPFEELAHVTHFVRNRPGHNRYEDFLDMLRDTVAEMERRYAELNDLGIEELVQARRIGMMTDTPFVVCVVEEASLMLICPDRQLQREIIDCVGQIANLGRGAGVFLVMATQYPSNQSIPNHLREQFSRIGFKVQDHTASNQIINESGLEDITVSGQGKMRCGGTFVPFRSFYLAPGDAPPAKVVRNADGSETVADEGAAQPAGGRPSDRALVLSHLPKRQRGTTVTGKGAWKPAPAPAIPAGIWDD